jgi:hypothetical protein
LLFDCPTFLTRSIMFLSYFVKRLLNFPFFKQILFTEKMYFMGLALFSNNYVWQALNWTVIPITLWSMKFFRGENTKIKLTF